MSEDDFTYSQVESSDDDRNVNRLNLLTDRKFYGREAHLQKLNDVYDKCCSCSIITKEAASRPFILVSGNSGVGKSSLVQHFATELNENSLTGNGKLCFFLSGKYVNLQSVDPYSAIIDAFNAFFLSLMDTDENELQRLLKNIKGTIGLDAMVLTSFVPCLRNIIGKEAIDSNTALQDSKETGWHRLKYVFMALLKAICSKSRPVIMFLDDLQWVDSASLDLITCMLSDKSIRYFMFVGAIRLDEVDGNHRFYKRLDNVKKMKTMEQIDLSNLSAEEVEGFVADAFELDCDATKEVSRHLYRKSRGNMFFARQTLNDLCRRNLLRYCSNLRQWQWSTKEFELGAGEEFLDDVVDAVASRIRSLQGKLQVALIIASYTRHTFDVGILQSLLEIKECRVDSMELVKILDLAVLKGFLLNSVGSEVYSFAHDQIQQAAYSLVETEKERGELKFEIGKRLLKIGDSENGKDWMLFVAADYFNSTLSKNLQPLETVRINFKVAKKATKIAAFSDALVYLKKGLGTLEQIPNHWETYYDQSIQYFQLLVDVELRLGNDKDGFDFANCVLEKANNIKDKVITRRSMSVALGRQGQHQQAIEMNKTSLSMLGAYNKQFRIIRALASLAKIKRLFKRLSDTEILELHKTKHESNPFVGIMLYENTIQAYLCANSIDHFVFSLQLIRVTFKHGISTNASVSFAVFSLLLTALGDHASAIRATQLSRKLMDTNSDSIGKPYGILITNLFVLSYNTPHSEVMQSYHQGFMLGMASGDIYHGLMNLYECNMHAFNTGFHIDEVVRTSSELLKKLESYKVYDLLHSYVEQHKILDYALGTITGPIKWIELEDFGPSPDNIAHCKSSRMRYEVSGYMCRLMLGVYFGNYMFADKMADKLVEVKVPLMSYTGETMKMFFSGLAAYFLARQTKKKRYVSKVRKQYNEMEKCFRIKGQNCHHRYLILKAATIALSKAKQIDVEDGYDYAIHAATKAEHIHDAALCNEMAAEYFFDEGSLDLATNYFTQAFYLYSAWGAVGKANQLKRNKPAYIDASRATTLISARRLTEEQSSVGLPQLVDVCSRSRGDKSSMTGTAFV